jgi:hypothetical protein
MKFIHIFINEFKTKWSTKLLVGVFALVVSSIFASSMLLKNEYDLIRKKPKDRFAGYQKIVNQPFKHIVIDSGRIVEDIFFENSNQSSVYIAEKEDVSKWAQNIFIKNDTLYISFNEDSKHKMNSYPSYKTPFLHVLAPNIESLSLTNTEVVVNKLEQKSLIINLLDFSTIQLDDLPQNMDYWKINMRNYSEFNVSNIFSLNSIQIGVNTVDLNLRDSSIVHMGNLKIENLKINGTKGNSVELSSETLMGLMKK